MNFHFEYWKNFLFNKKKNRKIELAIGDKVCFVKPTSDLICNTIVRGLLSKKFGGLESPTVYVLVADNKLDFYKLVEIAYKKYKPKLVIITWDFLNYPQIAKEEKDWLYSQQIIEAVKRVTDSIILIFLPVA